MGQDDLTAIEVDVLNALSRSRTTPSAVRLAAEVWQPGSPFDTGDPVGMVAFVLQGLNERGLVTYRLNTSGPEGQSFWERDMPHTIRLSFDGWEACGFPRFSPVAVGSFEAQRAHLPAHKGDPTDFRRHREEAEGGPIIREDLDDHLPAFPDHDHSFIFGDDMGEPDMTRPYTRVTPDMLANVIEARTRLGPLASYAEIAEETGESARTVRYLLTKAPLLRRMARGDETVAASLKDRIVHALEMLGPMKDATELRTILGHGDSDHDVVHVLHSLHKQGIVDFVEGRGAGEPRGIALRKTKSNGKSKVRVLKDPTETEMAAFVADRIPETRHPERTVGGLGGEEFVAEDVTVAQADQTTVGTGEFRLLRDLIQREEKRKAGDAKGMAYLKAAEALQDLDPDTARDLMAKAEATDIPYPSPVEAEYIRYAEAHPDVQ